MPTLEFFSGFEGCGCTTDCQSLFDNWGFFIDPSIPEPGFASNLGFNGGKCVEADSSGNNFIAKNVAAAKTKATGIHIKPSTHDFSTVLEDHLLRFTVGSSFIRIFNTSTGIKVYRNDTLIASSPIVISLAIHHIEFKLFSDASAGTIEMKVDRVSIPFDHSTGLNTGGYDITVIIYGGTDYVDYIWDNVYIADDFCGELIEYRKHPTSDISCDFSPLSGSDNHAMVDDAAQDGDSTYNGSSTVGHADLFGYEDAPADAEILGVELVTVAKQTADESRKIQHVAKQDSTDYDLTEFSLDDDLDYADALNEGIYEMMATAPDGTAWTPTKWNAINLGYKVTA